MMHLPLNSRPSGDHHLDVEGLGVTVRIETAGLPPSDREAIAEAWSGARAPQGASPSETVVPRARFHFEQSVADLSTQVTLAALTARRGHLWMVHAGAVADEDGRVIAFSGRSGMGKTTLISRLARDYAYVTDESVGVTEDGQVLPYRKPLSIIEGDTPAKRQVSPRDLGLRDLPDAALRLHAIVVLDRDDRHTAARLEDLDVADAIGAIAPQCSYLAELSHPLETLVGHIESVGGTLRLAYREADDAVEFIRGLFAAPRPRSVASLIAHRPKPASGRTGVFRTPVVDAVTVDGDRLALLRRGEHDETTVHIIDGIGPTLWHAANGASFDELVAETERVHGQPPSGDSRAAVRVALSALREAGLLEGSAV